MRSDIVPGATFPDYELPDHENVPRRLSEIQGDDPLVLTLARGHYCPKEHQQHLELAAFYPKIAVAYTRVATIATDEHHTLQEFRASVGAQWPFLSDPGRIVQQDLDIAEYTDPEHDPMIPHTLVLEPGSRRPHHLQRLLVLGPPLGRRPLARPAVGVAEDPPRLGPQHARPAGVLGGGRPRGLPRLEPTVRRRIRLGRVSLLSAVASGVQGVRWQGGGAKAMRQHRRVDDNAASVRHGRRAAGHGVRRHALGHRSEGRVGVVVDPDRREPSVVPDREDREPRLGRRERRARRHDVVLQRADAAVVDQRTRLEAAGRTCCERPQVRRDGRGQRQPGSAWSTGGRVVGRPVTGRPLK